MMLRRLALALALTLAACAGGPLVRCPDLTEVPLGASCAPPPRAIAIDGDLSDWQAIPDPVANCSTCFCTDCTAGQVTTLRATPTTDGKLALLVETGGAPTPPLDASYLVVIGPLTGPGFALALTIGSGAPAIAIGDNVAATAFTGLPAASAYGGSGVELALPLDALPLGGGALAYAVELDSTGMFEQDIAPTIATCWDGSSAICQPQ